MYKTTVRIDGMMCGMCESHVQDAVRKSLSVKKVKASHSSGTAEIISEEVLSESDIRKAINPTGYTVVSFSSAPYEKKKFRLWFS